VGGLRAQTEAPAAKAQSSQTAAEPDGQRDFDFEIGTWKIHLKRLLHPLSGSNTWVEFDGTSVTRKVWDGRANIEEFEVDSPATNTHIEGMTLRLYNPQSHEWRLYWANSKDGLLGLPMIGRFKNGRGEFYDQEEYEGRTIFVRYVWFDITPNSARFEQSFSIDGGKTWEPNWITIQTRQSGTPPAQVQPKAQQGSQQAFDFEFGTWHAHLKRFQHPLTGSNTWVNYDGSSIVRKLWNGRANFGEFEVASSTTHLEGLSLRLYNPKSHRWNIFWPNSQDGVLTTPMIGEFKNGRGEFFDQELFEGKAIYVRFIFSDITPDSFGLEQAFSADGGKTWEPNWIVNFTKRAL
jgi:hypothetical protein